MDLRVVCGVRGPFSSEAIISRRYVIRILTQNFEHLSDYEKTYTCYQQESSTAHNANRRLYCFLVTV
jgi:hypothetical protein